jgi:hypothetical protein
MTTFTLVPVLVVSPEAVVLKKLNSAGLAKLSRLRHS